MLWAWTHIVLMELMDNSSSDTVDELNSESGVISLLGSDKSKNVCIQILVEELTILTECSWQD